MSEKMSSLRQTADAQHYFSECFCSLFSLENCAIYRVSEEPDRFLKIFEFGGNKKLKSPNKYPEKGILNSEILSEQNNFVIINWKKDFVFTQKPIVNNETEIILLIRRLGIVELVIYGTTSKPVAKVAYNDTCRIISNFYIQVQDALQIRSSISNKQNELSGKISENTDTLIQLNEKLLQSNQELQQFAYSASHDLQEPLRNITSYINLFMRNFGATLSEEGREYLDFAAGGAQRMHHLIKDLLTYSKLDQQDEPMAAFEGNNILREALDNLHLSVEESNALILYPDLPVLYGNHSQILLLFQNLIDNAIKFRSKSEPLVFIDMEDKNELWEFKIKDNGIGIPQQFQNKIFGFFNRLHPRDKIDGSGLGLSICKKIVEKHNGNILVDSKPGKGSTFTFTLSKS